VFEGTGLLSSPQSGEQSCSKRNAPSLISALAGGRAKSNAVTRKILWREIAAKQPEARKAGG